MKKKNTKQKSVLLGERIFALARLRGFEPPTYRLGEEKIQVNLTLNNIKILRIFKLFKMFWC